MFLGNFAMGLNGPIVDFVHRSTVQITQRSTAARLPQGDANNFGPSIILGVGDYQGGGLAVWTLGFHDLVSQWNPESCKRLGVSESAEKKGNFQNAGCESASMFSSPVLPLCPPTKAYVL